MEWKKERFFGAGWRVIATPRKKVIAFETVTGFTE